MVYDYFDKYTFLCEMYDEEADKIIELVLNYFPFDNSCQVIDVKKGKNLVSRVQLPTLKLEMLEIGNIINIFSKLLLITDCAPATRKTLFYKYESTFALIKPVPPDLHGKIITFITKNGFRIVRMKNGKINKDGALALYNHISGSSMLPIIVDYVTSGEVIGLELVGRNAIQEWRRCLGATNPAEAEPGSLRHLYGENTLRNIAHGCTTTQDVADMLELFFGYEKGHVPRVPYRATFENCTCCVIKPHAVLEGNVGAILEQITTSGKFHITAMAMFSVTLSNAAEFYEVYKGVLPEYEAMSIHLAEGKCVALEIKSANPEENCICAFRQLCGPRDPDLCRQLYPKSIRALYGKTLVHNAVHCTDLPEDGESEVEYFFKLLANE
ncbi:nucleoside diphosphate kinase 7-like isoform X2 [Spodoptera litura]|uniref:Nucleoside diphosphate kinase 7-like isoform X2 n=1 Tax=Spodoptera litura TaxID=69820 RepID=A0A9J7E5T2_SPOLT|nr:nucleoside diphosphate kinase 7-like isoform X2 [Spodoptera litura]